MGKELKVDSPKPIPPIPPAAAVDPGSSYLPPAANPAEDLQYVAALAAGTAGQIKDISGQIVEGSSQLQPSQFDAHNVVKTHMEQVKAQGGQPTQPQLPVQAMQPAVPQQSYVQQAPIPAPVQFDDGQILRRLLALEDKLSNLERMGDKILKSLLKKNTKQVTIRFDDTQNTKQK